MLDDEAGALHSELSYEDYSVADEATNTSEKTKRVSPQGLALFVFCIWVSEEGFEAEGGRAAISSGDRGAVRRAGCVTSARSPAQEPWSRTPLQAPD